MNAPTVQTQGKAKKSHQEILELTEGTEMKGDIGKTRVRISDALGDSIGTRFFRVVALGALLVGAAALYSSMNQGEAVSQPASTETSQAFQDPAYLGSQDSEVSERVLDKVSAAFFGIGSPMGRSEAGSLLSSAASIEGRLIEVEGDTEIFDEGVLPGRYWTVRAPATN